jgi:hypothetical protein
MFLFIHELQVSTTLNPFLNVSRFTSLTKGLEEAQERNLKKTA